MKVNKLKSTHTHKTANNETVRQRFQLADMGQRQTLAELALEHEEELWKAVAAKNKKHPPRIARQVEDHEPLPDTTYERTCDHILNRAFKPAKRLLQNSSLLPANQQTADAVEGLFTTKKRTLAGI